MIHKYNKALPVNARCFKLFLADSSLYNAVKRMLGARYNRNDKSWVVFLNPQNLMSVHNLGFKMHPELREKLSQYDVSVNMPKEDPKPLPLDLSRVKTEMRPYQVEGVGIIHFFKGRCVVADDQGLGKTLETLAYTWSTRSLPCLVVCLDVVKYKWPVEMHKHLRGRPQPIIVVGRPRRKTGKAIAKEFIERFGPIHDYVVINYDIFAAWCPGLKLLGFKAAIYDECQKLMNKKAKRTKAALSFAKTCRVVLPTSGTPATSYPIQMYPMLQAVRPDLFRSRFYFAQRWCGAAHNGYTWTYKDNTDPELLHRFLVRTCMLRRLKKDVAKDLPPKIHTVIPVDIDNAAEYRAAKSDIIDFLSRTDKERAERARSAKSLVRLGVLAQLAARGKMQSVIAYLQAAAETGSKTAVYATHKDIIAALHKALPHSYVIDGSVKNKQAVIDRFVKDTKAQFIFCNIDAAGTGADGLQFATNTIVFVEFPHTYGAIIQAEDRIHRIGQKETANIVYLVARNTIDADCMSSLEEKRVLLESVVDGKPLPKELKVTFMQEVLRKYRREAQNGSQSTCRVGKEVSKKSTRRARKGEKIRPGASGKEGTHASRTRSARA